MFSLAMRSIRHRPGRFLATLLASFLGAAIIMAFNSMHDTAGAPGVDDVSAESLGLAAGVVGGYGTLLVFFAVASTLTVNVRQREEEISLLLINSLYAATSYRRREFGQQRLAGATPGQVLGMVGVEALVLTVTGVFFGTAAAIAGILPFTAVRTTELLPDQGPGIWLGIVAIAALATVVTSLVTARRTLRAPAVEAASVTA